LHSAIVPAEGLLMLLLARDRNLTIGSAVVLNGITVLIMRAEAALRLHRLNRDRGELGPGHAILDDYSKSVRGIGYRHAPVHRLATFMSRDAMACSGK
jgi:hypothetical protein